MPLSLPPSLSHVSMHSSVPMRGSGLAVASLILGILSLFPCLLPLGMLAVIFGHVSRSQIRRSGGTLYGGGLAMAGLIMGYLTTLILVIYGGIIFSEARKEMARSGNPEDLFSLSNSETSEFPEWGEGRLLEGSGVRLHDLQCRSSGPAGNTRLRVLLPPGESKVASLRAVLVPPAGSDLLSGMDLDEGDYLDEILPYAKAGMVVVSFSIDGAMDGDGEDAESAYKSFRESGAGIANAKVAWDFATTQIPSVDSRRIYSAGHSSAGTLSLLMAAHFPELAGTLAYAPICDVSAEYEDLVKAPFTNLTYSGLGIFVKRFSPLTHAAKTKVPLWVFGAQDDDRVETEDLRNYARAVVDSGGEAEIKTVSEGGHYRSMIDEGIPAGIEWIESRR